MHNGDDKMKLLEYLQIVKKRLWIILAIPFVTALASALISIFVMKPVYQAVATLIISKTPANGSSQVQYDDLMMYDKLVKTYAELAKSNLIANETISKSGYDMTASQLRNSLTVTPKTDTQIMEIAVTDRNPQKALTLTNTLAEVFQEKVKTMMNTEDGVKILDEAQLPGSPVKPKKLLNVVIAGFIGFMISIGVVFLMEYLDNTIKTENDVEKYLGLTVLASIPFVKEERK